MKETLPPQIERLLRELAPQVVAIVTRRCGDFAAAEDAVQEALLAAAAQWPEQGLPAHPRAWLVQVALRRCTDQLRSETARRQREYGLHASEPVAPAIQYSDETEQDDTLALLYLCCHPALTTPSAIALTLRAVGGLSTAEIAHAFLVPEATMAQRISRAKRSIRESGLGFETPTAQEREARLAAVLHVLYLIFNEGYAASGGDALQREDLAAEAIRLTRLLLARLPAHAESAGLLALMLLTDARRRARSGSRGELIPLAGQDRRLWDRNAIAEGVALVSRALTRGAVGPYQLQAAIAALHDEAADAAQTDWPQILALYGLLARMDDNPMVRLNQAIAAAMVHGPQHGLEQLRQLALDPRLASHHRLAAARAHLHALAGEHGAAAALFRDAAARTGNQAERDYLLGKAAEAARHAG
ncbi:RNA polymerase sigma factor [Tahibacter harae]|uniref:Sigma-70 family RNA polymerase sigma factor n=1 Tax=Tahibacter harae TaxID=2963937 RepID=A0ABT1QVL6_9GAMM|nr:sigma-70 family RNA polymerase sigma factor [Tahibacter harae]MCQ4166327.1 sigma-70 family RNA polymerase sigma factor [Tahibacter harae]